MSRRWADVVTVLGLAGLLASVSLTAPRWARFLRQPLPAMEPVGDGEAAPTPAPGPAAEHEATRTISVKLLFEAPERPGLVLEERVVPFAADLSRQIRLVMEELIKGSQSGLVSPLTAGTQVREVFVTARGVAYVDLSGEAAWREGGGSRSELMTVYSVVNSITANFPSIRRVQILVEDRPAATLRGHVDLSRPLPPDMTLLAAADVVPAGGPEASPAASPAPGPAPSPLS